MPRAARFPHRLHQRHRRPRLTTACGPGCPHPTPPACVGPGRQDAAGVTGGEAQPAAGRELLLPAVLLVSPNLGCDTRRLRAVPDAAPCWAEGRSSGRGSAFQWLLVASGVSPRQAQGFLSVPSGVRWSEGVAGPRRETWWRGSGSPCLAARLVITLLWPGSKRVAEARGREAENPGYPARGSPPVGEGLDPHTPSLASLHSIAEISSSELVCTVSSLCKQLLNCFLYLVL